MLAYASVANSLVALIRSNPGKQVQQILVVIEKEREYEIRMQVKSRIWLAVSEAAFKPENFLLPEFRHLFQVHLAALLLSIKIVIDFTFFGNHPDNMAGVLLDRAIGPARRFQQWERCLLGFCSDKPSKRFGID